MRSKDLSPAIHATVDAACAEAKAAWEALANGRLSEEARAGAMERVAARLERDRDVIMRQAVEETALTAVELAPEFERTIGTLRMFARVVREGAWRRAAIAPADHRQDADATVVGPPHDVRSMLVALGPVAVFGASNFPLAYGVCGGDTASAWAAGCPVVVKEHPAHPRTGRLLASVASEALVDAGMPLGMLGYVENASAADHAVAQELVRHGAIKAVGFTGSTGAGMAIDRLCRERPEPVPVFAEMGSVNPVVLTPGAVAARGRAIGELLAQSILLRFGQQCTCPGLVFFVPGEGAAEMRGAIEIAFAAATAREMLAPWIKQSYERRLGEVMAVKGVKIAACGQSPTAESARGATATLLVNTLNVYLANPTLRDEIFGPAAVLVEMQRWEDVERLRLPGSLTLTVHAEADDAADLGRARQVVQLHGHIAGRLIFNGVPTGVRVATAMVHSGPFPACNRPDTTAVGPRAIERWCRAVCWQNAPGGVLPDALR